MEKEVIWKQIRLEVRKKFQLPEDIFLHCWEQYGNHYVAWVGRRPLWLRWLRDRQHRIHGKTLEGLLAECQKNKPEIYSQYV